MAPKFAQVETGIRASEAIRRIEIANQNVQQTGYLEDAPQWYDVKYLAEAMFDARTLVRDAIMEREEAETRRLCYAGHPARQLVTAEIHSINMHIALSWHEYRRATAAYHAAWTTYQQNLRKI